SDAPAASSTVSMLLKVCSVCSTRSSLTTLPVFGSKPPWPDRKIHSPTVTPGEYGPAGAGSVSELTRAFMDGGLLEVGSRSGWVTGRQSADQVASDAAWSGGGFVGMRGSGIRFPSRRKPAPVSAIAKAP